jgi:hypothetical protein
MKRRRKEGEQGRRERGRSGRSERSNQKKDGESKVNEAMEAVDEKVKTSRLPCKDVGMRCGKLND